MSRSTSFSNALLDSYRKRYAEMIGPKKTDALRDYLLALWSVYLDRKIAGDVKGMQAACDEAKELRAGLVEFSTGQMADWFDEFRKAGEAARK